MGIRTELKQKTGKTNQCRKKRFPCGIDLFCLFIVIVPNFRKDYSLSDVSCYNSISIYWVFALDNYIW